MLKILYIDGNNKPAPNDTGDTLFKRNIDFIFMVEAPAYWWLTCDMEHSCFEFPKEQMRYCFDAWKQSDSNVENIKFLLDARNMDDRAFMQIMPLSTILVAKINLTYQQVVEICENYIQGEYKYCTLLYQWPAEREWEDFCETLLDIKGIRELVGGNLNE